MRINKYLNTLFIIMLLTFSVYGCKPSKKTQAPSKAKKQITTTPAGASIIFNGKEIGKTPYTITAVPKSYVVKLSKPGYRSRFAAFTVSPGKNKAENFKLEASTSSVLVDSNPRQALVKFNGKQIGETPCVLPDLAFGKYTVQLERSGYSAKDINFTIDSERPLKVFTKLENNIGHVYINTTPTGAKVILNGKNIGVTPFTGEYPDGTYKLRLQRSDYLDFNTTIAIQKGKKVSRNYRLHLRPGSFKIVTDPAGAKVYLGGKYAGVSPVVIKDQPANQDHWLGITLAGYAPIRKKVRTSPGHQETLGFDLKRNCGDLEFVINPPGVTVFLDGEKYTVTQKADTARTSKVITIKDLKPGPHVLKYTHRRAVPSTKTKRFEIIAGETTRLAPLSLWVPNAEITYNDNAKETVIILSEDAKGIFVEPQNGIRFTVLKSKIKNINYFKAAE